MALEFPVTDTTKKPITISFYSDDPERPDGMIIILDYKSEQEAVQKAQERYQQMCTYYHRPCIITSYTTKVAD